MKHNTYKGTWSQQDWYQVTLNDKPFNPAPSQKLRNHSPDGFAWGYGGSGPAQLALAILLEEFGKTIAMEWYQDFKEQKIATLPEEEGWTMTSREVNEWLVSSQPF